MELDLRQLPVMLRPSKIKHVLLLLVCVAFVVCGVFMVRDGEKMGYLCGGFFALGISVFVVNLLPGASYLRLEESGFTFCSLFRAHTVRWVDVLEFGVYTFRMNSMVAWNFVPGYMATSKMRRASRAFSGFDAALPDTYGVKAAVLAQGLAELRDRYGLQLLEAQGQQASASAPQLDNAQWLDKGTGI